MTLAWLWRFNYSIVSKVAISSSLYTGKMGTITKQLQLSDVHSGDGRRSDTIDQIRLKPDKEEVKRNPEGKSADNRLAIVHETINKMDTIDSGLCCCWLVNNWYEIIHTKRTISRTVGPFWRRLAVLQLHFKNNNERIHFFFPSYMIDVFTRLLIQLIVLLVHVFCYFPIVLFEKLKQFID